MDQAQAVAVHGTASGLERDIAAFRRHLRGTDKSPRTQQSYGDVLALFSRCLTAQGMPTDIRAIRREHVEAFIADLLERFKPSTAHNRYAGLQRFFGCAVEEEIIPTSPTAQARARAAHRLGMNAWGLAGGTSGAQWSS